MERVISPFKSLLDLRFKNENVEEYYLKKSIKMIRKFGFFCSIVTILFSILEIIFIYSNKHLNSFIILIVTTVLILALGVLCFILLFFINKDKKKYSFTLLLTNNTLSSLILHVIELSFLDHKYNNNEKQTYLLSFFSYFFSHIQSIFRVYYMIYFDKSYIRNTISNFIVIAFSLNFLILSKNFNNFVFETLSFTILLIFFSVLSYFHEKYLRLNFHFKNA